MKYKIKMLPINVDIEVEPEKNLLESLTESGIIIRSTCAGKGTCGKCKIIIKEGKYKTKETNLISDEERKKNVVLACQTEPIEDLVIYIPIHYGQIFAPAEKIDKSPVRPEESIFSFSPLIRKIFLKLEEPSLKNNTADWERIKYKLDMDVDIDINIIRNLSSFLRNSGWQVTLTIADIGGRNKIIKVEPGDTTKTNFGIALDIGTTTVVIYLVDMNTGKIINAKASYNKQISFGDDVITRIIYAEEQNGLENLNKAIIDTVNNLIMSVVNEESISVTDIYAIQCAGNTTMTHLFYNIPPDNIRKEPYVPVVNSCPDIKSSELGINIYSDGVISCVPGVASYVGGDIVAGVLACGMDNFSTVSLLIDLGTNGEIVLGNRDWLLCCACSAGPAFEGVGIKCGIHAVEGAIQRIEISEDRTEVKYYTIGNTLPRGICGSGLLDIPAELLKHNIIDRSGKFIEGSSKLVRRNDDKELEFVIVKKENSATGEDIVITESDILNLIRSKGAVFLGIQVLLEQVGLKFDNINHIYISGGFGTFIDIEKAIIVGLLPDLPHDKFSFIGNSSITGAKMCLLSKEARNKVKEIAKKMTYIELSITSNFMNEYTSTLFLPHTNIDLFPSVKKILNTKS